MRPTGPTVIVVVIRLASALKIAFEIEGLVVQALGIAFIHDVTISLVGVRVELIVHERAVSYTHLTLPTKA